MDNSDKTSFSHVRMAFADHTWWVRTNDWIHRSKVRSNQQGLWSSCERWHEKTHNEVHHLLDTSSENIIFTWPPARSGFKCYCIMQKWVAQILPVITVTMLALGSMEKYSSWCEWRTRYYYPERSRHLTAKCSTELNLNVFLNIRGIGVVVSIVCVNNENESNIHIKFLYKLM